MSEAEIAGWNQYISALLLCVLLMLAVVWGLTTHCGPECERCRKPSNRKHK